VSNKYTSSAADVYYISTATNTLATNKVPIHVTVSMYLIS